MPYILQTSRAKMPSKCWGQYRNVAVLEVDPGVTQVAMISERARGVRRIVWHSGPQNVGKTSRCAYERALTEAYRVLEREIAEELADNEQFGVGA